MKTKICFILLGSNSCRIKNTVMDEADFTSALSNDFMPLGFERMVSK